MIKSRFESWLCLHQVKDLGGGVTNLLIKLVPTTGRPVQENNNLHTPTDHMPDIRPSQFDVTPDTKVII